MQVTRDEQMFYNGLDGLIQRVNELREAINTFVNRLETEYATMNWTTVLDNFALLSGKMNLLNKQMRSDKVPLMKNFVVFPLQLNPNRDPELEKQTEGRVAVFNHDLVPLYLRTKPDPEVEEKIGAMAEKSSNIPPETLQKKIATMNKLATNAAEQVRQFRENLDSDASQRHTLPQLCSQSDTTALVSAITFGKGIKSSQRPITPGGSSSATHQGTAANEQQRATSVNQQNQGGGSMSIGKAPSAIKTNIKASTSMNPYGRQ